MRVRPTGPPPDPPRPLYTNRPPPPSAVLGSRGARCRREEGLRAPLTPRSAALSVGAAASFLRGPAHLPGGITKAKNTAVVTGAGGGGERGGGPDGGITGLGERFP